LSRSFKIFRIRGCSYREVVDRAYLADPNLADAPFEEQMRRFYANKATYSDYFSRSMYRLGHEVVEVVFDHEPAQKAWAREHNFSWTENWQREIPIAQMREFAPDVLYLHSLVSLPAGIGAAARELCPSIKIVTAYAGSQVYEHQLQGVDLMIVGVPPMVEEYRSKGIETHLVYHGFDPDVLGALNDFELADSTRYPFTFLGSSGFGYTDSFTRRYWLLMELFMRSDLIGWINDSKGAMPATHAMDWSQIEALRETLVRQTREANSIGRVQALLSNIAMSMPMDHRAAEEYKTRVLPREWDPSPLLPLVPLTKVVPDRCREPLFGLDFYDVLRRSDVTLNVQVDLNRGTTANMRMFEATGVGTCLLTDATSNLADLFEPDQDVVTYRTADECIEKSRFLRENPSVRLAIASAGQARTLKNHTVEQRCIEIDSLIQRFVQ
jgi:spore maturation protein CgeB